MLRLGLHIFPLIELGLIVASFILFQADYIIEPILCAAGAALFLNFTLHITVHHYVHFKFKNRIANQLMELLYSALLALPFSLYKMQHINHHLYNNLIDDVTSTWKRSGDKIVAKNFIAYSFFWFLIKPNSTFMDEAIQSGKIEQNAKKKVQFEFLFILSIYTLLIWLNPFYALFYFCIFYLGWSFIAITNYGQHLPISYNDTLGYTFKGKVYNSIFFNNGLHYEHHENPGLNYPELKFRKKSVIKLPHLIVRIFTHKIKVENEV